MTKVLSFEMLQYYHEKLVALIDQKASSSTPSIETAKESDVTVSFLITQTPTNNNNNGAATGENISGSNTNPSGGTTGNAGIEAV